MDQAIDDQTAVRAQRALDQIAIAEKRISQKDARDREIFDEVTVEFAHGRCAWFALAASQKYGLPLAALADESGKFVHVMCRAGDAFFDAYGLGDEAHVLASHTHFMGQRIREDGSLKVYETNDQVVRQAFELRGADHDDEIRDTIEVVDRVIDHLGIKLGRATRPKP